MSTDPKISDALEYLKHSPTPWIVREVHYEGELPRILIQRFRGDGMGYETIAMPYGQSHHRHNAAFIVRAVNAHDALVAALTKLLVSAKLLHANSVGCAVNHHALDLELFGLPGWLDDCQKNIEQAAAALARAGAP